MVDVEQVRKTLQKAFSILEEKGVPDSLKWIEEEGVGKSDEVTVDKSRNKDDFVGCLSVTRFTFRKTFYEIFHEDIVGTKQGIYPGDYHLRLMVNGEPVFVIQLIYGDIHFYDESRIKVLKLGRWVDDLPAIVKTEEGAWRKESADMEKESKRLRGEMEQAWATELSGNLDLGDYE